MSTPKILIVDDSSENIYFIETLLLGANFHVSSALNGENALKSIQKDQPDLILLDINMPGMGGLEVCEVIRQQLKLSTLPIIFISGAFGQEEEDDVQRVGGTALLPKPFTIKEIINCINDHLV